MKKFKDVRKSSKLERQVSAPDDYAKGVTVADLNRYNELKKEYGDKHASKIPHNIYRELMSLGTKLRRSEFKNKMNEEAPVNAVGSGAIAGTGDNPPVSKRKRKKFANCEVFEVDSDCYFRCLRSKMRYERFSKFIDNEEVAEEIRAYARSNPSAPIIIQDEASGAMTYLKLPGVRSR